MKTRHVFLMRDLESARMAVASLHTSGMPQEDISIVARADSAFPTITATPAPISFRRRCAARSAGAVRAWWRV